MSSKHAVNIFDLALRLTVSGMSVNQIADTYNVERRSAERMRDALEDVYGDRLFSEKADDNKTKIWRLRAQDDLRRLSVIKDEEIVALQSAIKASKGKLGPEDLEVLDTLMNKLKAAINQKERTKLEPDLEALMEAEGIAFRPGPRLKLKENVLPHIRQAILGFKKVIITYRKEGSARGFSHKVCPTGILYGQRPYLVAMTDGTSSMRMWRMDQIEKLELTGENYDREPFSLREYTAKSFGVFQEEPFEVEWEFTKKVAKSVEKYEFHPDQKFRRLTSGALRVTFTAGGALEMYWHLVQWGGLVKVIKPKDFAKRVRASMLHGLFKL